MITPPPAVTLAQVTTSLLSSVVQYFLSILDTHLNHSNLSSLFPSVFGIVPSVPITSGTTVIYIIIEKFDFFFNT